MVSDHKREVNTQRSTEQSNMTTIVVLNETNSKVPEFPISVSKRKLSHEITQQQHSKRLVIENTPLTVQPTLAAATAAAAAAAATEHQHRRISNPLPNLEYQTSKVLQYSSRLQNHTFRHLISVSYLLYSMYPVQRIKLAVVSDRHITSWAERISELNLYCHNCGYEKNFSTSCSFESKDNASASTNASRNISDRSLRTSYTIQLSLQVVAIHL